MIKNNHPEPTPEKLYAHNDKDGRTYIIAYRNRWDPVRRQARRASTRHVGRLLPDGRIVFSAKWLADHCEYAQGDFYYEANEIVTRTATEVVQAQKESGFDYRLDCVQAGVTLGLWKMALQRHLLEDLEEVFGTKVAATLLRLGIYMLDDPGSMSNYEAWLAMVYLPEAQMLSGQRISECLSTVTQAKMDSFFKLRHERAKQARGTDGFGALALDSTSISTYSNTIADACFGHAKQNPELKQVNLTFACDYSTGEALYAYEAEGSFNDVSTFPEILLRMSERGFNLEKTLLVTDRGYCSMHNVQRQINLGLKFIQGYSLTDSALKRSFRKNLAALRDPAFYSTEHEASAFTTKEKWKQATDAGDVMIQTYVHLYYDSRLQADQNHTFLLGLDEVIKARNEGRKADCDKWNYFKNYIEETDNAEKPYKRNDIAVRKALEFSGCFALRSNIVSDPYLALELYRRRNIVEQAFNQFKNQTDGSRLFSTQTTYMGKIFVHIIAQSLRMMLYMNAKRISEKNKSLKLPDQSITKALRLLRTVMAERPIGANHWILKPLTKKQRELLSLLDLDLGLSKHRLLS